MRIIKNRSLAFACFYTFCIGASFFIVVYYLPIWFQAVEGTSAVQSGINTLAMLLAVVVCSILGGGLTTAIGYYTPFIYLGTIFSSIGAALLTLFYVGIPSPKWIGYQIVFGAGIGFGMQQSLIAAQTVLAPKDVPTGTAIVIFAQMLGGSLFASVGQNVFTNKFLEGLTGIPGVDPSIVINIGATQISSLIRDPDQLSAVLEAYNGAITKTFQVALIMSMLVRARCRWRRMEVCQAGGQEGQRIQGGKGGKDSGLIYSAFVSSFWSHTLISSHPFFHHRFGYVVVHLRCYESAFYIRPAFVISTQDMQSWRWEVPSVAQEGVLHFSSLKAMCIYYSYGGLFGVLKA